MRWLIYTNGVDAWYVEGWAVVGLLVGILLASLYWRWEVSKLTGKGKIVVYPATISQEHLGHILEANRVWEEGEGWSYKCQISRCPATFSLYGFKAHLDESHRDYDRVIWHRV